MSPIWGLLPTLLSSSLAPSFSSLPAPLSGHELPSQGSWGDSVRKTEEEVCREAGRWDWVGSGGSCASMVLEVWGPQARQSDP